MSGIYIIGMEMPKSCDDCPCIDLDNDKYECAACGILKKPLPWKWANSHGIDVIYLRPTDCPLIEVPEPMKWIPVTERLPEYMENVLVTDGVFSGMGWRDWYDYRGTKPREDYWIAPSTNVNELNITHWMPLPEPPEDGEP